MRIHDDIYFWQYARGFRKNRKKNEANRNLNGANRIWHIFIWKCEKIRYRTWRHQKKKYFFTTKKKWMFLIFVVQNMKVFRNHMWFHNFVDPSHIKYDIFSIFLYYCKYELFWAKIYVGPSSKKKKEKQSTNSTKFDNYVPKHHNKRQTTHI